MATPMKRTPEMQATLDKLETTFFGMSNSKAIETNTCVQCHKPATIFNDALSTKEFTISGLCQACQDIAFAPCEDDVEEE